MESGEDQLIGVWVWPAYRAGLSRIPRADIAPTKGEGSPLMHGHTPTPPPPPPPNIVW